MRSVIAFFALLFLALVPVRAQEDPGDEAVLALLGVGDIEEADRYEVERLSEFLDRPLKLNMTSASRLASCGLFTAYQAASITDYRLRHGDILSYAELSLLDGFTEDHVRLVKPFVDLSSGELPSVRSAGLQHELRVRSGVRPDESGQWNYALKYSMESSAGISVGLGMSRPSSAASGLPESFTGTVEYDFRKFPFRFIAGDYNARFGQGLALWNGMSMSGLSSPSTFMRRPSGFSRSSSFTGNYSMTGVAGSAMLKRLIFNASVAFPGIKSARASQEKVTILPVKNLTWNFRNGQVGATHYMEFRDDMEDMKTSVDMAWCFSGTDVFAELAYDWVSKVPAGLTGVSFPFGESLRSAAMLRIFPAAYNAERSGAQRSTTKCSNEYSLSLAGEYISPDRTHSATLTSDIAYFPEPMSKTSSDDFQVKVLAGWHWTGERFALKMRLSERVRSWGNATRTDFRSDISLPMDEFVLNLRANLLHCRSLAGLVYCEGGYVEGSLSAYLRAGVFCADNWDDRIYVYERDAPGGFNVPAMYGRGVWTAATASWKPGRWLKLYGRASFTAYPFMSAEKKKPGRAELKLQCVFSF